MVSRKRSKAREVCVSGYREDVTAWLSRGLALEDGAHSIDYLSLCVRRTARSWPQHVRVDAHDRLPDDVLAEVLEHMEDIAASATAEGKSSWAVRVFCYRPGATPAGSRTFRPDHVPGADDDDDDGSDGTPQGEMVAAIRELRLLVRDQGQTLERNSAAGYQLAQAALEQAAGQVRENAELMVLLAETESKAALAAKGSPVMDLAPIVLQALPALMAAGAAKDAARKAEADAGKGDEVIDTPAPS